MNIKPVQPNKPVKKTGKKKADAFNVSQKTWTYGEIDYSQMGIIRPDYMVAVTKETMNNGFDCQSKQVQELLEIDRPYEVERISVGGYNSSITLKHLDYKFNSVLFQRVIFDEVEETDTKEKDVTS